MCVAGVEFGGWIRSIAASALTSAPGRTDQHLTEVEQAAIRWVDKARSGVRAPLAQHRRSIRNVALGVVRPLTMNRRIFATLLPTDNREVTLWKKHARAS